MYRHFPHRNYSTVFNEKIFRAFEYVAQNFNTKLIFPALWIYYHIFGYNDFMDCEEKVMQTLLLYKSNLPWCVKIGKNRLHGLLYAVMYCTVTSIMLFCNVYMLPSFTRWLLFNSGQTKVSYFCRHFSMRCLCQGLCYYVWPYLKWFQSGTRVWPIHSVKLCLGGGPPHPSSPPRPWSAPHPSRPLVLCCPKAWPPPLVLGHSLAHYMKSSHCQTHLFALNFHDLTISLNFTEN